MTKPASAAVAAVPERASAAQEAEDLIAGYKLIASVRAARVDAFPNLTSKLAFVMGEIDRIKKSGRNLQQNYDFVRESDIVDAVKIELARLNVSLRFAQHGDVEYIDLMKGNEVKGQEVRSKLMMIIENGDEPNERIVEIWDGNARDYGDKGLPKAMTSARKIAHIETFEISTGDTDPESKGAGDDHDLQRGGRFNSRRQDPPREEPPREAIRPADPPSDVDAELRDARAEYNSAARAAKGVGFTNDDLAPLISAITNGKSSNDCTIDDFRAITKSFQEATARRAQQPPQTQEEKFGTPAHREQKPEYDVHHKTMVASLVALAIQSRMLPATMRQIAETASDNRVVNLELLSPSELGAAETLVTEWIEQSKVKPPTDESPGSQSSFGAQLEGLGS